MAKEDIYWDNQKKLNMKLFLFDQAKQNSFHIQITVNTESLKQSCPVWSGSSFPRAQNKTALILFRVFVPQKPADRANWNPTHIYIYLNQIYTFFSYSIYTEKKISTEELKE